MEWKSIIQENPNECFWCGSNQDLQTHHCLHGSNRRQKADEDKLYVRLCYGCHDRVHFGKNGFLDKELEKIAQKKYMETHTIGEFIERYGKNYL